MPWPCCSTRSLSHGRLLLTRPAHRSNASAADLTDDDHVGTHQVILGELVQRNGAHTYTLFDEKGKLAAGALLNLSRWSGCDGRPRAQPGPRRFGERRLKQGAESVDSPRMRPQTTGTLLVGFDSAWTARRSGALVGSLRKADGTYHDLGSPKVADFPGATDQIVAFQAQCQSAATVIMLDQPTIVVNSAGQRPVENLVSGPVSRRYGGVQPSNTSRCDMFGQAAPVWPFLESFGGAADPMQPLVGTKVFETYPVLTMIAFDWVRPDVRPTGRLPKYNPERRKTFVLDDWRHVCHLLEAEFRQRGLPELADWCQSAAAYPSPRKHDQDRVDACICLLAGVHLVERQECLMIGDTATGYIVVPSGSALREEVEDRCHKTGRSPAEWIKTLNAGLPASDEHHDCAVTEHDVAESPLLSPRS